jgi:hypothetical protein
MEQCVEKSRTVAFSPAGLSATRATPIQQEPRNSKHMATPSVCVFSDLTSFPIKGVIVTQQSKKEKNKKSL